MKKEKNSGEEGKEKSRVKSKEIAIPESGNAKKAPSKVKKGKVNKQLKGKDGASNPSKIEETLLITKTWCRGRATRLLGAGGNEQQKPVLVIGPSLEAFNSPLSARVFKDGKIRYNNYCFNFFFFGDRSLLHYSCDISLDDQSYTRETAEEIKYSEIISFGQTVSLIDNEVKCSKLNQPKIKVSYIEIVTAGKTILCPYRIYDLEQAHKVFNAIDDKNEDIAIKLFNNLSQLVY